MTITYLQVVNGERLLGVEIDHFLSWSSHVQKTHTTIARHIALLCRINKYLPRQARQTFYHSVILPHMDYCSTLYGETRVLQSVSTSYINVLLESLQTLPTERPAHHSSNSFAGCRCLTASNTEKRYWYSNQ